MRRRSLQAGHPIEGINATPLIDVVMCLIVFFLLVGKLAADKGAEIQLPKTKVGEVDKAADVIVITVTPTPAGSADSSAGGAPGGWAPGAPSVTADHDQINSPLAMESYVRSRISERPLCVVQVRAQRDLAYGQVQPVLAAIAKGGASTVRLAMERAQ